MAALVPIAARALKNPYVRSMAKNVGLAAARGLIRAIKNGKARRQSRNYGGARIRWARPQPRRSGRGGRYGRGGGGGRGNATSTVSVPRNFGKNQRNIKQSDKHKVVNRELAQDSKNPKGPTGSIPTAVAGYDVGSVYSVALQAADCYNWPRLSQEAGLYQQFRFLGIRMDYSPIVGTDTAGTFYMGVVSDPNAVVGIKTYQDILTLPQHLMVPVWQACSLTVGPRQLNTQVNNLLTRDVQDFDPLSTTQCQGHIVWTVDGVANTIDKTGRITMEAVVELMNSKLNPDSNTVTVHAHMVNKDTTAGTGTFDMSYPLTESAWDYKQNFEYNPVRIVEEAELATTFQVRTTRPFKLDIATNTEGGTFPLFNLTSDDEDVTVENLMNSAQAGSSYQSWIVSPTRYCIMKLTRAQAGTATTISEGHLTIDTIRRDVFE